MPDITMCTNDECTIRFTCDRFGSFSDMDKGQSHSWFSQDDDYTCEMFMELDTPALSGDKNMFGSHCSMPSVYHTSLGAIYARYEVGEIKVEEANKAILLTICEYFESDAEALSEYRKLSLETLTLTLEASNLLHMRDFYGTCAGGKIKMIKEYRRISGLGLKEAKNWVEDNFNF